MSVQEPRDAYFYKHIFKHIFIIQIYKIFLLPRFAREGEHPPRVALRHALFRFFHHGAPPLSFSGSAPDKHTFPVQVGFPAGGGTGILQQDKVSSIKNMSHC